MHTSTATLIVCLFCTAPSSVAAPAPTTGPATTPATPAGELLKAFLTALNTGDRAFIRGFVAEHMAPPPNGPLPIDALTDRNLGRYTETGGMELHMINASEATRVAAVIQAKRTGFWYEFQLAATAQPPHQILGMGQRAIEAPPELIAGITLSEADVRERLDALIKALVEADAFSGAILVAKDGKPIYARAEGFANRGCNVRNTIETKFNTASVGKMFTAVAVAQLVEQGKLAYDDTVGKILPDYPQKDIAQRVTVAHLLSHTSGLPSGGTTGEALFAKRFRAVKDYLPSFADAAPAFEPGSKYLYSNNGYQLLGVIIEKASGQSYQDYVREHVFAPAGMTGTDNYDLEEDPPGIATGYMDPPRDAGRGALRRSNVLRLPVVGLPAGLGYTTVGDMVKFDAALRSHTLVSADSLKTLWTGRIDTDRGGQYGYGCHLRQYNGTRIVWHGGGYVGITNQFEMYPDLGYTVAIFCNIDNNPTAIALKLREWLTCIK
jgi:CubicO group peptidase (beta-lactamase class C family)